MKMLILIAYNALFSRESQMKFEDQEIANQFEEALANQRKKRN